MCSLVYYQFKNKMMQFNLQIIYKKMYLQISKPDEMFFHEQTDTFDLTVAFRDNKLAITLKDFVGWAIYEKQYTQDDVGKEVHKKMDLLDIYAVLFQTQPQCDEEKIKEKEAQSTKLKKYEFGSIVENQKLPCYKIERQGKITAYLTLVDARTKKHSTYQSNLALIKIRNMTEVEILTERSTIEKIKALNQLKQQIGKHKNQNQSLLMRVANLEQQNKKLGLEANKMRDELNRKKTEMVQKNKEFEFKIKNIEDDRNKKLESIRDLERDNQKLKNEAKQIREELRLKQSTLSSKISMYEDKLRLPKQEQSKPKLVQSTKTQPTKQLNQIKKVQQTSWFKFSNLKNYFTTQIKSLLNSKKVVAAPEPVSLIITNPVGIQGQMNSRQFRFNGLKVQYIGRNRKVTDFFFNKFIQIGQSVRFNIKIVRTSGIIYFGIADYKKQRYQNSCMVSDNAMCYDEEWKQGDILQVQVDRSNKIVKYFLNGKFKAQHSNNMLADSSRVFVPFVTFFLNEEIVEWINV